MPSSAWGFSTREAVPCPSGGYLSNIYLAELGMHNMPAISIFRQFGNLDTKLRKIFMTEVAPARAR